MRCGVVLRNDNDDDRSVPGVNEQMGMVEVKLTLATGKTFPCAYLGVKLTLQLVGLFDYKMKMRYTRRIIAVMLLVVDFSSP